MKSTVLKKFKPCFYKILNSKILFLNKKVFKLIEDSNQVEFLDYTFDESKEIVFFKIISNSSIEIDHYSIEIEYENHTRFIIEPMLLNSNKMQFQMKITNELAGRQIKAKIIPFKSTNSTQISFDQSIIGIQLNPDIVKLDLEKMTNLFKKNSTLKFEFNVFKYFDYYYYYQNNGIILRSNQLLVLLRKLLLNIKDFNETKISKIFNSLKH